MNEGSSSRTLDSYPYQPNGGRKSRTLNSVTGGRTKTRGHRGPGDGPRTPSGATEGRPKTRGHRGTGDGPNEGTPSKGVGLIKNTPQIGINRIHVENSGCIPTSAGLRHQTGQTPGQWTVPGSLQKGSELRRADHFQRRTADRNRTDSRAKRYQSLSVLRPAQGFVACIAVIATCFTIAASFCGMLRKTGFTGIDAAKSNYSGNAKRAAKEKVHGGLGNRAQTGSSIENHQKRRKKTTSSRRKE